MDRGAWEAAVRGVTNSWTQLSNITFTFHIYNIFFTHSSISEYLCCCHVLAIVNNAVINTGYKYLFELVFWFFQVNPQNGIARSYELFKNVFEPPPYCFPQWLYQFMFSPTVHKRFFFSPSLSTFIIACLLNGEVKSLSCVRLFVTSWTAASQAPLSMGFSRQEYWSGVPLPSPTYVIFTRMYTTEYYSAIKKEELLSPVTTRVDLEAIN